MTFEQVWVLFLAAPPALWMISNSYRRFGVSPFVINIFGTLMVLAFCLPGFVIRVSSPAAGVLTRALVSLSETDLRHRRRS